MNRLTSPRNATPPIRKSISPSRLWRGFLGVALALACVGPSERILAVTPPPDGGYPGDNTAEGTDALLSLTTGLSNTAIGSNALRSLTAGFDNTAVGFAALYHNTGDSNTAIGIGTLFRNTTGIANTATGSGTLDHNTTGNFNTATGSQALISNTTGSENTATGLNALANSTTGSDNTAVGVVALGGNTTGKNNIAIGALAGLNNTIGNNNTAEGFQALLRNTTGSFNVALGSNAGANLTTGDNNIDIGAEGQPAEANTIRIGKVGVQKIAYMQGISGATVASGVGVIVGSNGKLGTIQSSARFKEAVTPMDKASEAILALKPVTFRYKQELDPDGIPQFGLIAEQVEKINPDLVVRDADGKVSTVRYEAVNAMLLNEFLKEHRKVQELEKQIEVLTTIVEKVSDQMEVAKATSQLVANGQ